MKLNNDPKKYSENINQSDIILWCPKNNFRDYCKRSFDNNNKVFYLQRNKKCYNLEAAFQKKVNFFQ